MGWPKLSKQLDCCSVAKRSLSGKASIRRATLGILSSIVIAGCSLNQWYQPSGEYLQGEGFYSDEVTKREFQDAQRDGKISERGRVSERTGGCFNYTEALVDRNIVAPIVRKNLTDLERRTRQSESRPCRPRNSIHSCIGSLGFLAVATGRLPAMPPRSKPKNKTRTT
jgi:hypothetical protein